MKQFCKRVGREWERTALGVIAVLCLLALAVWVARFGRKERRALSRREAQPYVSMLAADAFAFLEPISALDPKNSNPFSFETVVAVKKPRKRKVPKTKPVLKKATTPAKKAVPPATEVTQPVKPVEKPKPRPPVRLFGTRIWKYHGFQALSSGKRVATIQVTDPVSGKVDMLFPKVGDMVNGVEIRRFDQAAVLLREANGRAGRIRFGHEKKVVVR